MSVLCRQSTKKLAQISCLYWKPLNIPFSVETAAVSCKGLVNKRCFSKNQSPVVENNEPVQFTSSEAARWRAEYSRMGGKDESPPSQPVIVALSLSVFMLYFLVFREENDIDIKIGGGGFNSTTAYLEYVQLRVIAEQNEKDGVQTDIAIINRLKELEEMKVAPIL